MLENRRRLSHVTLIIQKPLSQRLPSSAIIGVQDAYVFTRFYIDTDEIHDHIAASRRLIIICMLLNRKET